MRIKLGSGSTTLITDECFFFSLTFRFGDVVDDGMTCDGSGHGAGLQRQRHRQFPQHSLPLYTQQPPRHHRPEQQQQRVLPYTQQLIQPQK